MRIVVLTIALLFYNFGFCQIVTEFDTLTYTERMNGAIDSIDISSADLPTTFDGGVSVLSEFGLSTGRLFDQITNFNFQPSIEWASMQFSALPHLGFSYSFGGQTSQFLKAKYNHAFNDKNVLDINYARNSGVGSIRNSNFSSNNLKLQYQRRGLRYTGQLLGSYTSYNVGHSGGIAVDTLIEDFGLEYTPVNKENANSTNRVGFVKLKNYFNFLADSINSLGMLTVHEYHIVNRVYSESDYLSDLYPSIYIDSNNTRDQYNIVRITNGAGVYYNSNQFYLDGSLNHSYWDQQNLGNHTDTNEIALRSNLRLDLFDVKIKNTLKMNLIGAFNEYSDRLSVNYSKQKFEATAHFLIEQKAPTSIQRFYTGNHNSFVMANPQLQSWVRGGVSAKYLFSSPDINVRLFADYTSVSNVYLFNGEDWRLNDSVKFNFFSAGLSSHMKFGVVNIQPRFVVSVDEKNLLPKSQWYGRFYIKGRLFKAKKLIGLIGCDVSYISSFKTRSYIPLMDTYDWNGGAVDYNAPVNLHAFVNFGIDEFRFFIRYENIGYFWADKTIREMSNYPIAGRRMRIGITWDFFN